MHEIKWGQSSAQIHMQFYELTAGFLSGVADSKMLDIQSGYEKAYNHALVGNAGANLIHESAGMVASLLGFSVEQLIIDINIDIIGAIQHTIRGLDVSDEVLSLDAIRETFLGGPNHFLVSNQTLARMQTEYLYPNVGGRSSPKEWEEKGRPSILDCACKRLEDILGSHYPTYVSQYNYDRNHAMFPVHLSHKMMGPA
jgi:trimethylamine--corrinoid protein Co-methyltransferase